MSSDDIGLYAETIYKRLDIKESTFRRWASDLEKSGYEFQRNQRQQRIYYQNDVRIMQQLKALIDDGFTKQEAIKKVLENQNELSAHPLAPADQTGTNQLLQRLPKEDVALIGELIHQAVKQSNEQQHEQMKSIIHDAVEENTQKLMNELDLKLKDLVESRDREVVLQMQENYEMKTQKKRSLFNRIFNKRGG